MTTNTNERASARSRSIDERLKAEYERGYRDGYAARHGGGGAKPIGARPGEERLVQDAAKILQAKPDISSGDLARELSALGHVTRSGDRYTRDAALRLRRQLLAS